MALRSVLGGSLGAYYSTGDVEVNTTDIAKNIEDKAAETYGEPLSDSMDEEEYESNNESFDETPQLPHENGPTSDDAFSA